LTIKLNVIFNSFFERIINQNISLFNIVGSGFKIRTINNIKYFSTGVLAGATNE
jgi:hypothetical protein